MEHDFFVENSSQLGVFGQGEDFKLTTELSEKVHCSRNQAIKNSLKVKWSNTAYVNKWSFAFKIKLCVSQVIELIRIFNAQPVRIPHFKSLLTRKQRKTPFFFILKSLSNKLHNLLLHRHALKVLLWRKSHLSNLSDFTTQTCSLHKDKNAVYFFQISLFVPEIFKFLKYAN